MFRKSKEAIPGEYSIAGKSIICPHCQSAQFIAGEAQLNTALATLIELDWINKSAAILTCTSCSQIQWFGNGPERDS